MPLVFRGVKKTRWNKQKHEDEYDWLSAGEIPAETLVDVVHEDIKSNELSVYIIDNDEESLKRMVAAFIANRQRPGDVEYKVIDYQKLLEIFHPDDFKESLGYTPDAVVNTWHRDLRHLSISKLMEFVKMLYFESETKILWEKDKVVATKLVLKKDVEKWLVNSVKQGYIDKSLIKEETMSIKIDELLQEYS